MGARSVDPSITTRVIFTGEWSMPVKEAEAANSLIDQGVDVLTCHVDSPKVVVETAEKRGIFSSGYHASQAALAPKGYLTGAEWDWATPYTAQIKALQSGAPHAQLAARRPEGRLREDVALRRRRWATAAKAKADEIKAAMMKGGFVDLQGRAEGQQGQQSSSRRARASTSSTPSWRR